MGRATTPEGFVRPVAIKRVLPHLTHDEEFVKLFLEEARVALYLHHGNLVQTLDVGTASGTQFLVMEWVDGVNLRVLLRRENNRLPLGPAAQITLGVLAALAYAHDATDHEGHPLDVVHRDVSPPNILLSRAGEVKLADFGLARAAGRAQHTQPGIIKGKFGYVSPEAVHGLPTDRRTDLFAVGVILWEMLAGRRLFLGETDHQTLANVSACFVPELEDVRPPVMQVIRRSLARAKEDRFPNARAFAEALAEALPPVALRQTPFDLADRVERCMADAPPDVVALPLQVDPRDLPEDLQRALVDQDPLVVLLRGINRLELKLGLPGEQRSGRDRRKRTRDPGGRRLTDRPAFVERVLAELDAGRGAAEVAEVLNGEGLRTRLGTLWTARTLGQLARRARRRRVAEG